MTKASDWKTPLGYYERAIAELTRTRAEVQAELQNLQQIIKELQSSQISLQLELETTQAKLQATQRELQDNQAELQAVKAECQNTQAELQNTKVEFKTTNQGLESLVELVHKKVDFAVSEAKIAQNMASKAIAEIETVEVRIKNGDIVAQKALMLKGKDPAHWMKFHHLKKDCYHTFSIWNSDKNTWHKVLRVNVADKIVD